MDEALTRLALITGGASGFGRATAMELARRGWSLALQHEGDEDAEPSRDAALQAAREAGREVQVERFPADLTQADRREQLVEGVIEAFDRIDLLVNAAPPPPSQPQDLLELTEDAFLQTLAAGTGPTIFLTQLVASEMVRMVEAGLIENPKIVTINSLGSYVTSTDQGAQCVARAGLAMVTSLFADRLGEYGINVYEIRAGIIATGADDPAHSRYDRLVEQGLTPIRRLGRPGDVARAVAAVAEDLLSFSTGEVINVDGGFHLRRL